MSAYYDRYTYVGGGHVDTNGVLAFRTSKGDTWTLSQGYMRGGKDAIGLSTAKMQEELDTYVRATEKLKTWPKEWLNPGGVQRKLYGQPRAGSGYGLEFCWGRP